MRTWWVALPLSMAIGLTGCEGDDVSDADPGPTSSAPAGGPLVAQDVVRLDLREAPTREEAGFRPGERDLVLSRVGDAIDVELQLPGGTLITDAFGVSIGGPVGVPDPSYAATVVVNARGGSTDDVRTTLRAQAGVLDIDAAQVDTWADGAGTPSRSGNRFFRATSTEPRIEVEVRHDESSNSWTLNYSFAFAEPPV